MRSPHEPPTRVNGATAELLEEWAQGGVNEVVWGLPDADEAKVLHYLDDLAARLSL